MVLPNEHIHEKTREYEIFVKEIGTEKSSNLYKKTRERWKSLKLETCAGTVTNKGRDIHKLTLDLGAHGGSG